MPDESFIDITYIIKEEIKKDEDKNIFYSQKHEIKNLLNLNLQINKQIEFNTENIKKNDLNEPNNFYTPITERKTSSKLPIKFHLNPSNEIDDDLTHKIFSKIFNKNPTEYNNNSKEIIYPVEVNDSNESLESSFIMDYDPFCLGMFISGLKAPIEANASINENSYNFIAPCGHKNCSLLLSFKPELLLTYSNKNSPVEKELNYILANLCFPLGIKLCFELSNDNKEKKILQKSQNVYYNVIKNANDDIYYIATLQYYIKMDINEFKEKYNFDLYSYYSQKNNSDKKDNNFKKASSFISRLINESTIYIPESISLLSKYPFYIPMNICLNSIISLHTFQEKNNLINHIINEIPLPQNLRQIQFFIPSHKEPIILNHNYNIYKGLSMIDILNDINFNVKESLLVSQLNSKLLLEKVPIENIIILFQLILLEQQILIVENKYQILSEIIFILTTLIYPLTWTNPFLPILSLNTVQFLQTPTPYIMGIDEYLLKYAYSSKKIYIGNEIILYNIMNKNFILSRNKKKANKKDIMNELKLNFLPDKIESFMNYELKKIKIIMSSNRMSDIDVDMEIRLIFIKTMILLIGDYNNYTFYTNDDDMPLFNKEAFIESHKDKKTKLFLEQMTKTQLFNQFLLNERKLYFYNKNKNINKNNSYSKLDYEDNDENENYDINNYIDTSYFKKMIEKYPELINNEKIRKSSLDLDSGNLKRSTSFHKPKRSQSNNLLGFKFDSKKDIFSSTNNINIYSAKPPKEKKITIDFNNINSPQINELTKSYNINFNSGFEIKKSVTAKYNNIIIKKSNKIKAYLLYPYFLPKIKKEELKSLNPNLLYEKVLIYNKNNKYQIASEYSNNKIYILSKTLNYKYYQTIPKRYYIESNNNNGIINSQINNTDINKYQISDIKCSINGQTQSTKNIKQRKKSKSSHKKGSKNKYSNKDNNLIIGNSPKISLIKSMENDENIELINKFFTSCCTNKHRLTKEQLMSFEKIFSITYNKNYFANLIIPDMRIKNKNQHKQLMSTSFDDLKTVMKICLEKLTHEENHIARLLTIACFSYFKIDKDNNIFYLYQYFNEGAVYPCKLWLLDEFWMEFFKIEMKEANRKEDELYNNYDNSNAGEYFDNDKSIIEFRSKYAILMENSIYLSKLMYKLNLNQIFIVNVFEKMILPVYECDYYNINNIIKHIHNLFLNNIC